LLPFVRVVWTHGDPPHARGDAVPTEKLTSSRLRHLTPPAAGFDELLDTTARGLSLRIFPTGRAGWSFRYRPKGGGARRRINLGEYPTVGLAEARRRADRARGEVSGGGDPQGALSAKREAPTVADLIDRYLAEEVAPKKKARTLQLYTYYLQRLVAPTLGPKKAHEVTPGAVDALHRRLGKKTRVTANRVLVTLSGVYRFAARRRLIADGINPARGIEKFREQGHERYLSTDELGRLGLALRLGETDGLPWPRGDRGTSKHDRKPDNRKSLLSPHVTAAVRLLLFTGCRLREILGLRWSEVDGERGLLQLLDSKTGRKAVVLNGPAMQVLAEIPRVGGCEFVILGDDPRKPRADLAKPWKLIRHHAGLNDVRLHDLRHTHASIGAGAGLGLPIIGRLLGHKHADTTARYAHLDDDPLRRASNRIGSEIAAGLGESAPAANNVRPIR
jgi:integrase